MSRVAVLHDGDAADTLRGMARPFRLDQPLPIVRQSDGRFREIERDAELARATHTVDPQPQRESTPMHSEPIPWPPARSGPAPFKVGG